MTVALASASSPETKTVVSSPSRCGSTISELFMVLRLFTTRASGCARWIDLGERVVVLDEQLRREAVGVVERVRDVEQHLAGQVLGAGALQDGRARRRRRRR